MGKLKNDDIRKYLKKIKIEEEIKEKFIVKKKIVNEYNKYGRNGSKNEKKEIFDDGIKIKKLKEKIIESFKIY